MKKRTLNGLSIVILILCLTGVASATSLYSGDVTNYASIYQFELGYPSSLTNVTISGSYDRSIETQAIWIYGPGIITTIHPFNVIAGEDIFVQFLHTDSNDGLAIFETSTNGSSWTGQGSVDTYDVTAIGGNGTPGYPYGPNKYALISGLDTGAYYLRITSGSHSDGADDLHLDSYGTTPVPEPATMFLLGFGLVGIAGLRRKFRKA